MEEETAQTEVPLPSPIATMPTLQATQSLVEGLETGGDLVTSSSAVDPLIEHLKAWHLSTEFNVVLDKVHIGYLEELEEKLFIDYEMEEKSVGDILRNLIDSTMLIYFTE